VAREVPKFDSKESVRRRRKALRAYIGGLREGPSRRTTEDVLKIAARQLSEGREVSVDEYPWEDLRAGDVEELRGRLIARRKVARHKKKLPPLQPATANKVMSSVRALMERVFDVGLITADDLARIMKVKRVKGSRVTKGRALSDDEVARLLAACDLDARRGVRDHAIIAVMHGGGLRRDEVGALMLGSLRPNGVLRVIGKGDRERIVPLPPESIVAIERWLKIRGRKAGPLFPRFHAGRGKEKMEGSRLSSAAVYKIVETLVEKSRIDVCAPHDFRRTYASDGFDAGIDIVTLQGLMGHANVSTTASYDRRHERARIEAVATLAAFRRKRGNEANGRSRRG